MYIIDGIAYAGEQPKPVRVKAVRTLEDYKVLITFTNDERRVFDFMPLLDMPCYQPLRDKAIFSTVYVEFGTLVWNDGDIDIAPETLLEKSIALEDVESA
ncbi:MAG: DUF2442 domain-containing protein [Ruminococcus sp.]|nr:DUF2442 domain-containing protein [Oscillospiraceae bacterium]MBQ7009290.1 DUF2442 domain-containing protein [Ruminococcus sp.]